jgi:tetratricopeptide (TPR) repeat protein
MTHHLRIVGTRRTDRLQRVALEGDHTVVARCHQRLRGPYTGVDTVLTAVLPDAARRHPELVEQHRVELLYGVPELEQLIGPAPRTLASESPFAQRTRWFGTGMIRCMSQGIVSFLLEYTRRSGDETPSLVFEEVHAADRTTQEFIALLVRRADPDLLRVVVSGTAEPLLEELETVLAEHATRAEAEPTEEPTPDRDERMLAEVYVTGDGTSDDPAELDAYRRADPDFVRRLHDRRADELEGVAGWGSRIGAIAYHREHGSDPAGAGSRALLAAQRHCLEVGFSATVVDLGRRGRAITDPVRDQQTFRDFTAHVAQALVSFERYEESMELFLELRRRYALPKVHMTTSYGIAMLYTRFFRPRDHETAAMWQNNAIAIAGILPDPTERLVFGVFQDNGMSLIEMHRGNLGRALELVEGGIARLDEHLTVDDWVLHRSQLLYNRARLLTAMGRLDEAYADYSTLVDLDPYYTDYLSERAKVSRLRGDLAAALADYDRAEELAPPYPELYYNRGTARAQAGDVAGALADFGYVLEMEPDELDTRLARAELLAVEGDLDAGEADVREGLSHRPGDPQLLCMKGTLAVERGSFPAALDALDAALAADPRYPAALVNRAVAHFECGHPGRAVDDLTAALEIVGADPDVLLDRGVAYLADGRPDLASADFDRAGELPGADVDELRRQRELCGHPRSAAVPESVA